jgi:ligand-binding SRPBCC domain-containing protein
VKIFIFSRAQLVHFPLQETFAFFSDPRNLELLTPAFLHFRFVHQPPPAVEPGTILDYRLRLYGVPLRWRTRIESVEPPIRFVDVQERGPYAMWKHTHTFRDIGGTATEMTDRVEYALPFGAVGEIANRLFVKRSLRQIFDYRQSELTSVLGAIRERGKQSARDLPRVDREYSAQ